MAEYIEREEAVHLLMTRGRYLTKDLVMDAAYEVSKIPAADVAPVRHGRWVEECVVDFNKEFCSIFFCSNCGKKYRIPKMNYCPNCGAKMDLEGGGGA